MKITKILCLIAVVFSSTALFGCNSAPIEESKPMQAGDGSQKPVAAGATPSGGAPAAGATNKGSATSN